VAASLFVNVAGRAPLRACRDVVTLRTQKPVQFVDLTALVAERVRRSGVREGIVLVQSRHTTTAVVVNENEPQLLQDVERELQRWAPAGAGYRHDDLALRSEPPPDERPNAHAHLRALLLGASVSLAVANGRMELGGWQSVLLVELDGPRQRTLSIQVVGAAGASGCEP